jgi:Tfp pilus assembly protein PilF
MEGVNEALARAVRHHEDGQLQAAEAIYRQILSVAPNHADALNLLGVLQAPNRQPTGNQW